MKNTMQALQELAAKNGPLCVGLDTSPSYIPDSVLKEFSSPAQAVLEYNRELIKRIAETKSACCFKVQIAYYEAMGLEGMKVYAETIRLVKESGLVCISDIKRGDIAATAGAYAKAHFEGDFETDIITVNPYMGFDTLKPFAEYCKNGKGMFVLLRTSNPGMTDIEQQELKDGGRVLDRVGNELVRLGKECMLDNKNGAINIKDGALNVENDASDSKNGGPDFKPGGCLPVGAVVGCTEESDARLLRDSYPKLFFLIPGYGAQGGDAAICRTLLEKAGGCVNSSRGILCAWKKDEECIAKEKAGALKMSDIVLAAEKAALKSKADLTGL